MSMMTQCPACGTAFRVTPEQLQAQEGKVRCGRCMTVFDGFARLAPLPEPAEAVAQDAEKSAASRPGPFELESPPGFPEFGAGPEAPPQPEAHPQPPEAQSGALDAAAEVPPETAGIEVPAAAAMPQTPAAEPEYAEEAERRPRRGASWLWAAGSVLSLCALAAQAAYFYRSELASDYPALKPALVQLCEALACNVPLRQQPKLISVEASDLQIADPARPNVIQLAATLRNRAGYDLAYPALDLVLTDTREHTLARRIFVPEEYLERGRNAKAGIPASAEITIRLDLDIGNLGAAGFRLGLLAAPAR